MKSMKSKIIIGCLLLIVGIGFFINSSFSFFKKTKTQDEDNIVTTNCFEVALINDTNGINLTNAYPVKDEDGLKMAPYTFTVKNVCQNEENVFIQLDMNKDNTVDYSHVKVSLDGDANLSPTLLNELVTSNSISEEVSDEYNRAKIMTTKKLAPEEQITLNLRMWLDYEKSDISDQNALFTSKVEVITSYRTEDINTMPYIVSDTKYVGNKTVEATYHFKSDSVNIVGYVISEVEIDNPLWINIQEKTKDYEVVMNYTENKTYYLYVKDERGNIGSKVVVIDPTDKEKPVINGVNVTSNMDSEISVNNSINIEVDATDDTDIVKYYYSLDNETYVEVPDSTYTFNDVEQDDYIVYVYVEDSSGNRSLIHTESLRVGTPAVRNVNTGVEYFSIEKGAIASNDGDTLIALRNIKESANIPTGKNFTFDIAGYTITRVDDTIIDLYGDSVLRITDSTWDSEHPYGTGKFTKGDSDIIAGVGAIYTQEGTTLNLDHVTITENIGRSDGGGLSIGGTATIDNCLISDNIAQNAGGGILVSSEANVTISNSAINSNEAQYAGGILVSSGANVTISNSIINSNESKGSGGGVLVDSGANVTISNSIINSNESKGNGGGILVRSGGTVEINNTNIDSNNSRSNGGGIFANGSLKLNSGTIIENNTSTSDSGGVYIYENNASNPVDFQMHDGVEIKNNKAGGNSYGGGICLNSISSHTIDGGLIEGNTAKYGAGMYINNSKATTNLSNLTIQKNTASYSGGGLSVGGSSVAVLNGLNINNNSSVKYGGGIIVSSGGTVEINNTDIDTNNSELGGGIFANGSLKLNSGAIIENNTSTGNGGGIYIYEGNASKPVDFQMHDGVVVRNNQAGENNSGGGIYLANNSTNTIDGGLIEGNRTRQGAGIFVSNSKSTTTLTNITIQNNIGTGNGGGIYANNNTQLILNNSTIDDNEAENDGGGINTNGSLTLNDGTVISNNFSNRLGGGISMYNSDSFTINGTSKIIGNIAVTGGGISFNQVSQAVIENGLIDNNEAMNGGGGFYATNSSLIMNGGKVSNNISHGAGGGIYSGNGAAITINNGLIDSNQALKDEDSVQPASGYGAGIFVLSTVFMNDGILSNNVASDNGGAVQVNTNGNFIMNGGTIKTNSAKYGGGIDSFYDLTIAGGEINNNTCSENGCGAAIRVNNGDISENIPILNLTGGRITSNTCSAETDNLCGAVSIKGTKSEYKVNVNISGNPVISGNVDGNGNSRDLIYNHNSLMYISGPMTSGASIGVGNIGPATYSTIATYTDSAGSTDYKNYFFSNISGYNIGFDAVNRIIKFVS